MAVSGERLILLGFHLNYDIIYKYKFKRQEICTSKGSVNNPQICDLH